LLLGDEDKIPPMPQIRMMADRAADMLDRALGAFVEGDVDTARAIPREDDAVDALLADIDPDGIASALRNNPADEIDQEISLRRASSKVFILGLLAAEPRRPVRERQLELWDDGFLDGALDDLENDVPQAANESDAVNPAKVYFSLTDQRTLGSAVVIRLPGVRKEDILSADADTLRSFLLDEQAVERLAAGDVDGFLSRRRCILAEYFARFVTDRWGDRTDTRPSICSILEHAAAS
jgi:hypothetical protein